MSAEMRSAEPLTPDEATLTDVINHVRELEEKVESQADRIDSLEEENAELREMVGDQPDVTFEDDRRAIETLRVDGLPFGRKLKTANEASQRACEVVFENQFPDESDVEKAESVIPLVDNAGSNAEVSNASAGLSEDVRSKMLPIHEMWMDVTNGREDRLGNNVNDRRGARLFGNILRRADRSDDHENELWREVDVTEQNYVLTSTGAKRILNEMEDPVSPPSQTVKRAMQQVEQFSNRTVSFDDSEKVNRLVVRKDALHAVMETVQDAINGEDSTNTSEETQETDTSEDVRQEAEETLGQLEAANADD